MPLLASHAAIDATLLWGLPLRWFVSCWLAADALAVSPLFLPLLLARLVAVGGARWQLAPSFAGWCACVAGFGVSGAVLGLVSVALDRAFPLPIIAGLPGDFGAGVVDYEWDAPDGTPCIGRLFYPTVTRTRSSPVAHYIAFGDRHGLTRRFMKVGAPPVLRPFFPEWILQHWTVTTIPAVEAAPLVLPRDGGALPVVVFSHGLTATREVSTSLALTLAQAGAAVLLVEHADRSSSLARFMDGRCVEFDFSVAELGAEPATEAYKRARRGQTEARRAELAATLALLRAVDAGEAHGVRLEPAAEAARAGVLERMRGRLQLGTRLALGGHSFGGCAALALAAAELERAAAPPLGALFTLDPAVDWLPEAAWPAVGYGGVVSDGGGGDGGGDGGAQSAWWRRATRASASAPPLSRAAPTLTVWSEQWVSFGWYQGWARRLHARAGAAAPSCTLTVAGCGHQGLCDLGLTVPHWLNKLVKTSLGLPSAEMATTVNEAVRAHLRNAGVLAGPATDLRGLAHTVGHLPE